MQKGNLLNSKQQNQDFLDLREMLWDAKVCQNTDNSDSSWLLSDEKVQISKNTFRTEITQHYGSKYIKMKNILFLKNLADICIKLSW